MTEARHAFVPDSPRLHYIDWLPAPAPGGVRGVPVLLVHGFLGHARQWASLAAALTGGSLRAAPRRVVAPDLRGRGESESPAQGYSVAAHAADIARIVAAAGLQRFLLLGFSMGVAYAAAYAAQEPAPVAAFVAGDYPPRTLPFSEAAKAQYLAEPQVLAGRDPAALRAMLAETQATQWWDPLAALRRPVLVLRGGDSPALTEEDSRRYARLGARVVTASGAGHDVLWAVPRLVLRELWDLLFWLDMETLG